MRFPTEESERLRQQAILTREIDKRYLSKFVTNSNVHCLDLGCGPGIQTLLISEAATCGTVTGVDISEDMLKIAREVALAVGRKNVEFVRGDVCDLKFENNNFDFAFSRLLFQHLKNPQESLGEMHRVLKPQGRIVIIETDGSWQIRPKSEVFYQMFLTYEQWIGERKGDRKIGLKIGEMLKAADFENVTVEKEMFDFDKAEFDQVVLNIFPPIREQMIASRVISEQQFDENMRELANFAAEKLEVLSLPLYYWTATKPAC